MTRRYFSPEFKVEAASTVLDNGLSIREACDTFDVGGSITRRWIQELEAQVRQLEQEKEILKKATAFFVQEQADKRRFTK